MADVILGERSRAVTVGRSHFATADDEELGRQVEEWQAAPRAGKASMLKRGSTKPCDLDTYELDWDDLGMQLPSMPQKAPSAPEPAPAPASAPAPGPVATQANPAEEWTLARLERKVMEEESFEKRRKSSSAMRALEECYEDAAWDSFDVSETAEVAPAQPMPLDVQVPQELRRPSEEQPKLGESRPRAKETPPRGPPAMRPGQAPAAGPQRRVQCPAPGVPGGNAAAEPDTQGARLRGSLGLPRFSDKSLLHRWPYWGQ
ncbi:hypothetical protein AK812_SmicGene6860 [Symbiodinium microadriaticum]|uniref:Uncharacterized protein n=1 Tax=Symbiodinium microadriaticum TaxID=2951 RepID=A0A1Q9EQ19_SYMMI|nr:hypothetical protein AK812_SmicGene6860 [Symbiodinium microadriaticum]